MLNAWRHYDSERKIAKERKCQRLDKSEELSNKNGGWRGGILWLWKWAKWEEGDSHLN